MIINSTALVDEDIAAVASPRAALIYRQTNQEADYRIAAAVDQAVKRPGASRSRSPRATD